jgi:hypothetical protein
MEHLSAARWSFSEHFGDVQLVSEPGRDPTIQAARGYLASAAIANHLFFRKAFGKQNALALWAAQESVITNHFSQTLFAMMSLIKNVHLRSALLPVVTGEHSELRGGRAVGSHPHLLAKLVADLGVAPEAVEPIEPTIRFADVLTDSLCSLPRALGCLGIGNEAMLVPEYTAVEKLFAELYPRELYRPFLRANIEEDRHHSNLMEIAAVSIFRCEYDRAEFLEGARIGINGRLRYYDGLIKCADL